MTCLQSKILSGEYPPALPYIFNIHDLHRRKDRVIEAPHCQEAIVERVIWDALNPFFEKLYIPTSYCGITGRGTEYCRQDFMATLNQLPPESLYFKSDIHHYYDSIDHNILRRILQKYIKDLRLVELILAFTYPTQLHFNSKGIGIGHLVSQLVSNIYLNEFDQFIVTYYPQYKYFRYADDFVILNLRNTGDVRRLKAVIAAFLKYTLHLCIKERSTFIEPICRGGDFIGCVFRYQRRSHIFVRHLRHSVFKFYHLALRLYKLDSIICYLAIASVTGDYPKIRRRIPAFMFFAIPRVFNRYQL